MKTQLVAAACAAAVLVVTGARADKGQATSPNAPAVTFADWAQRVQKDLGRHLHYPAPIAGQRAGSGIVRVKFNCSETGRPADVALAKSSGSVALDRAALRAVSRMASMHPLPAKFDHGQKYIAAIYFSDGLNGSGDDQLRRMMDDADKSNGWAKDPVVALSARGAIGPAGN